MGRYHKENVEKGKPLLNRKKVSLGRKYVERHDLNDLDYEKEREKT